MTEKDKNIISNFSLRVETTIKNHLDPIRANSESEIENIKEGFLNQARSLLDNLLYALHETCASPDYPKPDNVQEVKKEGQRLIKAAIVNFTKEVFVIS